jgi:hypothetical protein
MRNPRHAGILKTLLIILGIIAAIVIALGIWAAMSWRSWAATGMQNAAATMVQQSGLDPQQQQAVMLRVQTLATDFKAGKISIEQMQGIAEQVAQSPLLPAGVAWGLQERYVAVSLLNDQEKAEARMHLQRIARGVIEKKIPLEAFNEIVAPVSTKQPNDSMKPKDQLTLDELKALVARAKAKADGASIPSEPFTIDIATELDNAIAAAKVPLNPTPKP